VSRGQEDEGGGMKDELKQYCFHPPSSILHPSSRLRFLQRQVQGRIHIGAKAGERMARRTASLVRERLIPYISSYRYRSVSIRCGGPGISHGLSRFSGVTSWPCFIGSLEANAPCGKSDPSIVARDRRGIMGLPRPRILTRRVR
jgi:hypothetical protein